MSTTSLPKARRAPPAREASAGSRLPYARHVDDLTIATRDGMLMQVVHIAGLSFETADTEEINYRKALRDGALRAFASSRFAIYHHVVRREVAPVHEGDFGDDFSRTLDEAWRSRLAAKKLYVNELFLTLVRRPLQGRVGLVEGALRAVTGAGAAQSQAALQTELRALDAARESLMASLAPYGARVLSVYDSASGPCSEPLEFLGSLYNGASQPMLLPQGDLGQHIPARRVTFGAEALELSPAGMLPRSFAAVVSVKEYPPQTAPGMLDDLLRLPHELVISQSFGFVDRQASLNRMNLALRRMRAADDEALSLRQGLSAAKDDVASGRAAFGEHHLTVLVRAPASSS